LAEPLHRGSGPPRPRAPPPSRSILRPLSQTASESGCRRQAAGPSRRAPPPSSTVLPGRSASTRVAVALRVVVQEAAVAVAGRRRRCRRSTSPSCTPWRETRSCPTTTWGPSGRQGRRPRPRSACRVPWRWGTRASSPTRCARVCTAMSPLHGGCGRGRGMPRAIVGSTRPGLYPSRTSSPAPRSSTWVRSSRGLPRSGPRLTRWWLTAAARASRRWRCSTQRSRSALTTSRPSPRHRCALEWRGAGRWRASRRGRGWWRRTIPRGTASPRS
jgi:hypothetical protein